MNISEDLMASILNSSILNRYITIEDYIKLNEKGVFEHNIPTEELLKIKPDTKVYFTFFITNENPEDLSTKLIFQLKGYERNMFIGSYKDIHLDLLNMTNTHMLLIGDTLIPIDEFNINS